MGQADDVVEAGTRLMADTRIIGRGLVVGPKVRVDGDLRLLPMEAKEGEETAIWEAYAHDYEEVDVFSSRFVRMVNNVELARGWIGWASDTAAAITRPARSWFSG